MNDIFYHSHTKSLIFFSTLVLLGSCGVSKSEYAELDEKLQKAEATLESVQRELQAREDRLLTLQQQKALEAQLLNDLEREIENGSITVSRLQDQLSIQILGELLFRSGSTQISEQGEMTLRRIAKNVEAAKGQNVFVKGHTDNVPIGDLLQSLFETNWELSTARATSVVRSLIAEGMAPSQLVAAGYSQYRPKATNETAEGRQINRRIEIILVPEERTIENSSELLSELKEILSQHHQTSERP